MLRKTFSLLVPMAAATMLLGLQTGSLAHLHHTKGQVYFSGNVQLADSTRVRSYISSSLKNNKIVVSGEISLIGPDGKVISDPTSGQITSATTATLSGSLTFNKTSAKITIDMTSAGTTQTMGWVVTDQTGNVLWSTGTNSDGSIKQLNFTGVSKITLGS